MKEFSKRSRAHGCREAETEATQTAWAWSRGARTNRYCRPGVTSRVALPVQPQVAVASSL